MTKTEEQKRRQNQAFLHGFADGHFINQLFNKFESQYENDPVLFEFYKQGFASSRRWHYEAYDDPNNQNDNDGVPRGL